MSNDSKTPADKAFAWLFSHCRALGMTKKSDSGTFEHDIALFVADLHAQRSSNASEPDDFDHAHPDSWKYEAHGPAGAGAPVEPLREAMENFAEAHKRYSDLPTVNGWHALTEAETAMNNQCRRAALTAPSSETKGDK
jgi:hypothetical protein